jgi:hypothetical protein
MFIIVHDIDATISGKMIIDQLLSIQIKYLKYSYNKNTKL